MTKDKKQINVASSCYGAQKYKYKNKRGKWKYKNEIICYYNKTKGGVDLVDCFAEIYKTQRKTYKWWKSLLFYFIEFNNDLYYNVSVNKCILWKVGIISWQTKQTKLKMQESEGFCNMHGKPINYCNPTW